MQWLVSHGRRPPSGGLLQLLGIVRLIRRLQAVEVIDGLGGLGRGGEDRLLVGLQDGDQPPLSGPVGMLVH